MNLVLRVGLGEPIEVTRDGCLLGTITVMTKSGRSARVKINGRGLRGLNFLRGSAADDRPTNWDYAWPASGETRLIHAERSRLRVVEQGETALVLDRDSTGMSLMTYRGNTPVPGRVHLNRDEVIALAGMLLEEAEGMQRTRKHKETANVQG